MKNCLFKNALTLFALRVTNMPKNIPVHSAGDLKVEILLSSNKCLVVEISYILKAHKLYIYIYIYIYYIHRERYI